ncbi:hypothetical protein [Nocardiopsis suaedae]|uniref:LuxR family transcriptional regulator n=1 Tax=Nocardiopsis suaedae TaxID=3018444 RepID=A0ABT4TQG5_9ACTN|nr:hypothetical protein [Nocardiopsis suaedae]MDA2806917.1 hypothetical protein [Nocardiopsis suaedae]
MTSPRFLFAATVLSVAAVLTAPVPASAAEGGTPPAVPSAPAAVGTAAEGAATEGVGPAVLAAAEGSGGAAEGTEDMAFPWTAVGAIVLVLAGVGFRAWQMFGRRSKRPSGGVGPAARDTGRPRDR